MLAVTCFLIHMGILIVRAAKGLPAPEKNSSVSTLLNTTSRYAGIGLIGVLALTVAHWFPLGMATVAIGLLVASEEFMLLWWAVAMRSKPAVMRELTKREQQKLLQEKAKKSDENDDDKNDDDNRKGPKPPAPTEPVPSASEVKPKAREKSSGNNKADFEMIYNLVFDDLRDRAKEFDSWSRQLLEFVEIDGTQKAVYDGAIVDKYSNLVSLIEIKYLRDQQRPHFYNDAYMASLANHHPLSFVLVFSSHGSYSKETVIRYCNEARDIPGVKGVLAYTLVEGSHELDLINAWDLTSIFIGASDYPEQPLKQVK